jgi:hypothetical protein
MPAAGEPTVAEIMAEADANPMSDEEGNKIWNASMQANNPDAIDPVGLAVEGLRNSPTDLVESGLNTLIDILPLPGGKPDYYHVTKTAYGRDTPEGAARTVSQVAQTAIMMLGAAAMVGLVWRPKPGKATSGDPRLMMNGSGPKAVSLGQERGRS